MDKPVLPDLDLAAILKSLDPLATPDAQKAAKASSALAWFARMAGKPNAHDIIKVTGEIIAIATPDAEKAQAYVKEAVACFTPDILAFAIRCAQTDLAENSPQSMEAPRG